MHSNSVCAHVKYAPLSSKPPSVMVYTHYFLYFCSPLGASQQHTKNIRNMARSSDTESRGEDLSHTVDAGLHH